MRPASGGRGAAAVIAAAPVALTTPVVPSLAGGEAVTAGPTARSAMEALTERRTKSIRMTSYASGSKDFETV